jgi:hypothetical protein
MEINIMIEIFLSLIAVSFTIERIVEYIFSIKKLKQLDDYIEFIPMKLWLSIILSFGVAYFSNIDMISLIVKDSTPSLFGVILTGILISGGSNIISDIIRSIKSLEKNKGDDSKIGTIINRKL